MATEDANSPPETAHSSNTIPLNNGYGHQASSSSKAFALKTAIQTTSHVRQISSNEDWSAMAVSLSSIAIKFYSPETDQFLGECKGHTEDIEHIAFTTPHLLHSCSLDGTIRAWDTRTLQQVSVINAAQVVYSFSFGSEGNLLAGGCESEVLLWDWRTMKQLACLEDNDRVSLVKFIPDKRNMLLYASNEGVSISDANKAINGREHLKDFKIVGESVDKAGLFGTRNQKLWCYSDDNLLSIWDLKKDDPEVLFEAAELFPLHGAPYNCPMQRVDYLIDCHSTGMDNRLWVICGTTEGTVGHFPITSTKNNFSKGAPEAILEGGHTGKVTCVLPMSTMAGHSQIPQSVFGWTGGEDGKLCCWVFDETSDSSPAWMSSKAATKSSSGRKSRYNPY